MIIFSGKAKDLTFKRLLFTVFFEMSRVIEPLEAVDFSQN